MQGDVVRLNKNLLSFNYTQTTTTTTKSWFEIRCRIPFLLQSGLSLTVMSCALSLGLYSPQTGVWTSLCLAETKRVFHCGRNKTFSFLRPEWYGTISQKNNNKKTTTKNKQNKQPQTTHAIRCTNNLNKKGKESYALSVLALREDPQKKEKKEKKERKEGTAGLITPLRGLYFQMSPVLKSSFL